MKYHEICTKQVFDMFEIAISTSNHLVETSKNIQHDLDFINLHKNTGINPANLTANHNFFIAYYKFILVGELVYYQLKDNMKFIYSEIVNETPMMLFEDENSNIIKYPENDMSLGDLYLLPLVFDSQSKRDSFHTLLLMRFSSYTISSF